MKNTYEEQASAFLASTNTKLDIIEAEKQKHPLWAKKEDNHGIHYTVTMSNPHGTYTFDFWDNIHNREIIEALKSVKLGTPQGWQDYNQEDLLKKEKISIHKIKQSKEAKAEAIKKYEPSEYDILACLSPLYEDTLEDFCSSFGYEEDSILALKTFEACKEQDRNLRKLFDRQELELLTEIS